MSRHAPSAALPSLRRCCSVLGPDAWPLTLSVLVCTTFVLWASTVCATSLRTSDMNWPN